MYSLVIALWLVIATPVLVIGEEATPALSRNEALNSQLDKGDFNIPGEQNHVILRRSPGYKGTLKVKMIRARGLPDTDGWWDEPDPYAVVVAVDKSNNRQEKRTVVKRGTCNPYWNQELDFGHSSVGWRYFTITVYDSDNGGDDNMTGTETVWVSPSCTTNTRLFAPCVDYNYRLEDANVNHCSSNPCVRGTCRDQFCGFSCSCPADYWGHRCERYNPPPPPPPPSSGGIRPLQPLEEEELHPY